jgi:hypothetical protein
MVTTLKTFTMCVLMLTIFGLGCSHTMSTESTRIRQASWQADLDEYQEVILSVSRVIDSEDGAVVRTYQELTLEVRPLPYLQFENVLKSIHVQQGSQSDELRYKDIEVRSDESGRRVWFVDTASRRVIATLDRDTRATTGPDDEPPSWATVDGGVMLGAGDESRLWRPNKRIQTRVND